MELKEFISNTLTQMADGVSSAIKTSEGRGYLVNPSVNKIGADCKVHFELSIESAKEGEMGIKVLGASLSERSLNRISFDIDMTLPTSGNLKSPER